MMQLCSLFHPNPLRIRPCISAMAWNIILRDFIRHSIVSDTWMLQPDSFSGIICWSCTRHLDLKVPLFDFQPLAETNSTKHPTSLHFPSFIHMCLGAQEELFILVNIRKHFNKVTNIRQKVYDIVNFASNDIMRKFVFFYAQHEC